VGEIELIQCLLDRNESLAARDDAALDLADYEGREVETALVQVACDVTENEMLQDSAAEALKEIWSRKDVFHMDIFNRFTPMAKHIMKSYLIQYQQTHTDK
jgi:hypothetical protein